MEFKNKVEVIQKHIGFSKIENKHYLLVTFNQSLNIIINICSRTGLEPREQFGSRFGRSVCIISLPLKTDSSLLLRYSTSQSLQTPSRMVFVKGTLMLK